MDKYLDLLKSVLCASLYDESAWRIIEGPINDNRIGWRGRLTRAVIRQFRRRNVALIRTFPFVEGDRENGYDWPLFGYTMTGRKRLDKLHWCIDQIISNDVPGDFIETGVWRGGSVIFMRAVLATYGAKNRIVWCADSFAGMPKPMGLDKNLKSMDFSETKYLNVSLDQVKANFSRFNLLDEQVKFLPGWFSDTLPSAPIERLSLLRLDGDLYESTWTALNCLYGKVSQGGYVIVDDYGSWTGCREAVDKFRKEQNISSPIEKIDGHSVFWKV